MPCKQENVPFNHIRTTCQCVKQTSIIYQRECHKDVNILDTILSKYYLHWLNNEPIRNYATRPVVVNIGDKLNHPYYQKHLK